MWLPWLCLAASALRSGVVLQGCPHQTATPRAAVFLSAPSTAAEPEEAEPAGALATQEFPSEATTVEQLQRGLTFASRALPIVASYFGLYFKLRFRERVLEECLDEEACEVLWEEEHEQGSKIFSDVVNELKGFYTKTGQIIATRQDLFPKQYTDRLSGLTDLVDPMDYALVRAVVEQELLHDDEPFESVFAEFDREPLGAASVAQVHRAVLMPAYGGTVVAVKVRSGAHRCRRSRPFHSRPFHSRPSTAVLPQPSFHSRPSLHLLPSTAPSIASLPQHPFHSPPFHSLPSTASLPQPPFHSLATGP